MNIPYRIQRMLKRLAVVAAVALVVLALVALCWFLWLDRYVVYTRSGAQLDFERTSEDIVGQAAVPPENDNLIPVYYNEGDDTVETSKDLSKMAGYYIDTAALTSSIDTVMNQIKALPVGTPVLLEVKNSFGSFYYNTDASPFRSDSIDTGKVDELIRLMNQKDLYTIACLPALRDYSFGLNYEKNGLPTAGGYLWADEEYRYWLDPTKEGTLSYLAGIANELRALGFHEVVFMDFRFPETNSIVFNGDKAQALAGAAQFLMDSCSTRSFAVSFQTSEGFVLPEGRGRVYATGVDALEAKDIAENAGVADPVVNLVFITDLYDTRFDEYSVLRPLSFAGSRMNG